MASCSVAKPVAGLSALCALALMAVAGFAAAKYRAEVQSVESARARGARGVCSDNGWDMSGLANFTGSGWHVSPCADAADIAADAWCGDGAATACTTAKVPRPAADTGRPLVLSRAGEFELLECTQQPCPAGGYTADLKGGDLCDVPPDHVGPRPMRWHLLLTVACPDAWPGAPNVPAPGASWYGAELSFDPYRPCTALAFVMHESGCVQQPQVDTHWAQLFIRTASAAVALLITACCVWCCRCNGRGDGACGCCHLPLRGGSKDAVVAADAKSTTGTADATNHAPPPQRQPQSPAAALPSAVAATPGADSTAAGAAVADAV